jgi:enoyl-CoA hydratase
MTLKMPPTFLYEKRGQIAIMTWNRPERRNSFTPEMIEGMSAAFDDFHKDPNLWVAVWTGAGSSWCAGGDLEALIPLITAGEFFVDVDPTKKFASDEFKPIIAAVNGFATLELILGTDLRIASENASFALGEVRWGMIPAGGSHIRLPQQIPWAVAMELLLMGRRIDARRAYDIGLVNEVVAPDELMPRALQVAETLCKNGPLAVRTAKEIAVRSLGLEPGFVLEHVLFERVRNSEDAKEGPRAYMEKREPRFTGH